MSRAAEKVHPKVAVRVRPITLSEKRSGLVCSVLANSEANEVVVSGTKIFRANVVYGTESTQVEVYKTMIAPVMEDVMKGYNCTVFAYGQTGTGKTFTMEGDGFSSSFVSWETDNSVGIIPRAVFQIFETLSDRGADFNVRISFVELYNEELFDLFTSVEDTQRLRLFDDPLKKGAVVVHGLEEKLMTKKEEVFELLATSKRKRQVAATLVNAQSGRSHCLFTITVNIRETIGTDELLKTGKINLVDLAGSENVGRSGAVDKRAREAGQINQSLLTLGRVISAILERAAHIPYRESKLTRLLQDSLSGGAKTAIIACISPSSLNLEETLSTLDFAVSVAEIKTLAPEINQKLTKKIAVRLAEEVIPPPIQPRTPKLPLRTFDFNNDDFTAISSSPVTKQVPASSNANRTPKTVAFAESSGSSRVLPHAPSFSLFFDPTPSIALQGATDDATIFKLREHFLKQMRRRAEYLSELAQKQNDFEQELKKTIAAYDALNQKYNEKVQAGEESAAENLRLASQLKTLQEQISSMQFRLGRFEVDVKFRDNQEDALKRKQLELQGKCRQRGDQLRAVKEIFERGSTNTPTKRAAFAGAPGSATNSPMRKASSQDGIDRATPKRLAPTNILTTATSQQSQAAVSSATTVFTVPMGGLYPSLADMQNSNNSDASNRPRPALRTTTVVLQNAKRRAPSPPPKPHNRGLPLANAKNQRRSKSTSRLDDAVINDSITLACRRDRSNDQKSKKRSSDEAMSMAPALSKRLKN